MYANRNLHLRFRSGLSIIEIAMSAAILGGVGLMTLQGIASMSKGHLNMVEAARADLLARELMDEILSQNFEDSIVDSAVTTTSNRSSFDSIDDYDGWNVDGAQSAQLKDGTLLDVGNGWTRRVSIRNLSPTDISQVQSNALGVKQIRVVVLRFGKKLNTLTRVRTRSWSSNRTLDASS